MSKMATETTKKLYEEMFYSWVDGRVTLLDFLRFHDTTTKALIRDGDLYKKARAEAQRRAQEENGTLDLNRIRRFAYIEQRRLDSPQRRNSLGYRNRSSSHREPLRYNYRRTKHTGDI